MVVSISAKKYLTIMSIHFCCLVVLNWSSIQCFTKSIIGKKWYTISQRIAVVSKYNATIQKKIVKELQ